MEQVLAVGASGFITGSYNSGAAFVYQYNGGSWIPLGGKIDYEVNPGRTAGFGSSISLSSDGTIMTVGSKNLSVGNYLNVGAAFAYSLSENTLHATKNLKITDNIKHDNAFYSDNTIELLTNTSGTMVTTNNQSAVKHHIYTANPSNKVAPWRLLEVKLIIQLTLMNMKDSVIQ